MDFWLFQILSLKNIIERHTLWSWASFLFQFNRVLYTSVASFGWWAMATLDCNQQEQKQEQEQRLGYNARVAGAKTWSSNCFYKVNFIGGSSCWQFRDLRFYLSSPGRPYISIRLEPLAIHYSLSLSPSSFETWIRRDFRQFAHQQRARLCGMVKLSE
jgi:hypothetical protein